MAAQPRSDAVDEKLRLLADACARGRADLARSLASSVADSMARQRHRAPRPTPAVGPDDWHPTADLPAPWRPWAQGWSHFAVVEAAETAGLPRELEPIDLEVAGPGALLVDPERQVRVARVADGRLHEVPSQVANTGWEGDRRCFRLLFQARVAAGGKAVFLVLAGNPAAERPGYVTDLSVRGEGWGLDVDHGRYTAVLSRQMGQLERLIYKGEHGLELFAGGEGHGEPPNIDWAHDYLDVDGWQKFRVTNWDACPGWEVVRGPVCVEVRRFGFPRSPLHPVYTQSRLHMDMTYAFWAGVPWFLKTTRFEAVRDFSINYMRDDEWVFSGYSFTDSVWMDRDGRLHEGPVAAGHEADLWGVGFFNKTSRDAFIALWLEHEADGFTGLRHVGSPTLNYKMHGQLWSRWCASGEPHFAAGDVLRQRNAYLVSRYDGPGPVEAVRRQLLAPLAVSAGAVPAPARDGDGRLARSGEGPESAAVKKALWDAAASVRDPMFYEATSSVVDLGYVYDIGLAAGVARVLMTMPHRGRPKYRYIGDDIHKAVAAVPGVERVVIDSTWEPAWTPGRMSAAAWREMGMA